MMGTTMSDIDFVREIGRAYNLCGNDAGAAIYASALGEALAQARELGQPVRLERDPSQPIGLPCPRCGERPAYRSTVAGKWHCPDCDGSEAMNDFTLADVLRYLWNRKS